MEKTNSNCDIQVIGQGLEEYVKKQQKSQEQEKLLRRKLDILLRTGKLLVESAADTSRILRNMKRTAAFLGLPEEHLHIYVLTSSLFCAITWRILKIS